MDVDMGWPPSAQVGSALDGHRCYEESGSVVSAEMFFVGSRMVRPAT